MENCSSERGHGRCEQRDGPVHIRIVEDDHRRLAAQFEIHPFERGRTVRGEMRPTGTLPV